MNNKRSLTRRTFLKYAGLTAGAAALAACTPQAVTQMAQPTATTAPATVAPAATATSAPAATATMAAATATLAPAATATPAGIVTPQGRTLPPDAAPLAKQIYIGDGGAEPKFFDGPRDIYSQAGLLLINETLIHNDENMTTVPSLADTWKPGPQATYWEFHIRDGAVWSDGTPITADDIIYTYVHLADPTLANPWVWFYYPVMGVQAYNTGKKGPEAINDPTAGGVRKVDDRTVQLYGQDPANITSSTPASCPFMPALLSYQASVFVPKHIAEKDPQHWADTGIGLVSGGPFICTNWEHNVKIEYDINPKYNGPQKPGIQHMVTPILPANGNSFNNFLNQEVTLEHALAPQQVAQIRGDPKLNPLLHFFSNFQTEYMVLNTFMPPLDNLKVRQALSHAVDRDTLCNQVLNGTYTPAFSMLPPGFPAYNPDLAPIQNYDVKTAQQLLSDAGYPGGKKGGQQLTLDLFDVANDPKNLFVKQQWEANLGIKVNLNEVESGVWSDKRSKHQMQVYKGPYEYDYVDPNNLLAMLFHSDPASATNAKTTVDKWGSPRHGWYNADFDKLCDQAAVETDVAKRLSLYQQAEKILVSDVGAVFLTHQIIFQIWWPWLVGLHPDKTGNVVFRWLDITQFQMYISKDVDTLMAQYKGA